jgi:hypothetical protein
MCLLIGRMSQKRNPEDLSKINWNARKAGEEASQVKKQQNSDTDLQTANKGSGHKKTLWLEGKTMTEKSSVDKQSLSPGFCVPNVKSGPTISVVALSTC